MGERCYLEEEPNLLLKMIFGFTMHDKSCTMVKYAFTAYYFITFFSVKVFYTPFPLLTLIDPSTTRDILSNHSWMLVQQSQRTGEQGVPKVKKKFSQKE